VKHPVKTMLAIACLSLAILTGCASQPATTTAKGQGRALFQTSTIHALLDGVYDGSMTLGELKTKGNLGIGTFDKLDGEMILLDGAIYQVRADGKVYRPTDSATTPFACAVPFTPAATENISSSANDQELKKMIDALADKAQQSSTKNFPLAIRIDGTFSMMKTRSVPAQKKPYPRLAEVTKNQPEFMFENVRGTVVGFRLPEYLSGVNVPGYHLHFLSDDKTCGGHILGFTAKEITLQVAVVRNINLSLPKTAAFGASDLQNLKQDELKAVEQDKAKAEPAAPVAK